MKPLLVGVQVLLSVGGLKEKSFVRPEIRLEIDDLLEAESRLIETIESGDGCEIFAALCSYELENSKFTESNLNITLEQENYYLTLYPL